MFWDFSFSKALWMGAARREPTTGSAVECYFISFCFPVTTNSATSRRGQEMPKYTDVGNLRLLWGSIHVIMWGK